MTPTQAVAPVVLALRHEATGYAQAASLCDDGCAAALIAHAFYSHCAELADVIERAATTGCPELASPDQPEASDPGLRLSQELHRAVRNAHDR